MAWRSSKPSLAAKRRIPKRHRGESEIGLPAKTHAPISIDEIRRLGQDMVLASRAFEQGVRSRPRSGGGAAAGGAAEPARPARRGATR